MANQNFNQTNQNKNEKPITRPISKDFDKKTYQSSETDKSRDFSKNSSEKNFTDKNKSVKPDYEEEDDTVERGGMDDDAER